jgi:hypothetical protein
MRRRGGQMRRRRGWMVMMRWQQRLRVFLTPKGRRAAVLLAMRSRMERFWWWMRMARWSTASLWAAGGWKMVRKVLGRRACTLMERFPLLPLLLSRMRTCGILWMLSPVWRV